MNKSILALLLLVPLLGGCLTDQNAKDTAQVAFDATCVGLPVADASFQRYAATGKVSASVIRLERDAVAGLKAVCDNPPTNKATALKAAAAALAAIVNAESQARAQTGGTP